MSEHILTGLPIGPPEGSVVKGVGAAEVRWILPGQLRAPIVRWFGRFPCGMESREDAYLIRPVLRGLSVKIRGGRVLEVKSCHGSRGILDAAGRARGHIEFWRKWSFPIGLLDPDEVRSPCWTAVHKRRWSIRFQLVRGSLITDVREQVTGSACAADLTEVRSGGEIWWSLGFEATGPASLLRGTLQSAAALMFAETPPGDVELDMSHCQSYAEWLSRHRVPGVTETRGRRHGASI